MKLSCCGLDCEACDAFIAMRNDDDALRATTAEKWSKQYNHPFRPEDINCSGCRAEGAKIGHCTACPIRLCCIAKEHPDCGLCGQFPCESIKGFFQMFPDQGERNRRNLLRLG